MKICPSCSARLGDDVTVCSSCEYRYDAEGLGTSPGVQKTMMGLPALTDYRSLGKGTEDVDGNPQDLGKSPVGSTLFGLPALNFADAFSDPSEASDASTSMISAKDLRDVLRPEVRSDAVEELRDRTTSAGMVAPVFGEEEKGERGRAFEVEDVPEAAKMTAFGMRAPTAAELEGALQAADRSGESGFERLSGESSSEAGVAFRGWGIGEELSDEAAHTQVVSAEALQRSGFGGEGRGAQAIGFGAEEYSSANHTIMGMAIDSETFADLSAERDAGGGSQDDATRSVNVNELLGAGAAAAGLQNVLDKVRSDTLSRQTTSLNVPSVSSTPASGLVRIRPGAAQAARAMMSTPVMHAEDSPLAAAAETVGENTAGVLQEAPASGVFKKLKRRLAVEAAEEGGEKAEDGVSGSGVYRAVAKDLSVEPTSVLEPGIEFGDGEDAAGLTLTSMADELASIPAMSEEFAGVLSIPENFGEVEPVRAAEKIAETVAEPVEAVLADVAEVVETVNVVEAPVLAGVEIESVAEVSAARADGVKAESAEKQVVVRAAEEGLSSKVKLLALLIVAVAMIGLVLVVLS